MCVLGGDGRVTTTDSPSAPGDCWYCVHGWPAEVRSIYDRYVVIAGWRAMNYGPAHIVWSDENFDHDSIRWCIEHFGEFDDDLSEEQRVAVRSSLDELLALPESTLCPIPEEFDPDDDPADWPPAPGFRMAPKPFPAW